MTTLTRQLVALDMLSQDMLDELSMPAVKLSQTVSPRYITLLNQYHKASCLLQAVADSYTEHGFSDAIDASGMCAHLVNKKMLLVQNRLIEYVTQYYQASLKADQIRDADFSARAEIKFTLLTTKSIKLKSQYRTVAKAMSRPDYEKMIAGVGLADFDWCWDLL